MIDLADIEKLKKLHNQSEPFTKTPDTYDLEYERRARANQKFFILVHKLLPDLLDEILIHRNVEG